MSQHVHWDPRAKVCGSVQIPHCKQKGTACRLWGLHICGTICLSAESMICVKSRLKSYFSTNLHRFYSDFCFYLNSFKVLKFLGPLEFFSINFMSKKGCHFLIFLFCGWFYDLPLLHLYVALHALSGIKILTLTVFVFKQNLTFII